MSLKKPEEETASSAVPPSPTDKSEEEPPSSVSSEHKMEAVKEEYEQLCRELNMDESTMDTAWKSYMAIRHNYTLEVKTDFLQKCDHLYTLIVINCLVKSS
jgi:hypothetical protein